MPRYRVLVQNVFFLRACADVVDNQRRVAIFSIGNNADMGQTVAVQFPRYNVACLKIALLLHRPTLSREKRDEIRHTPVVNIGVGAFQAPAFGIDRKVFLHVLMNTLL